VKWSKEVINTCPDTLELGYSDDDSGAVLLKKGGVYEIVFAFFVPENSSKPSVQLKLNGKPVLSTIDS